MRRRTELQSKQVFATHAFFFLQANRSGWMHMYQLCGCRTPQLCVGIFQRLSTQTALSTLSRSAEWAVWKTAIFFPPGNSLERCMMERENGQGGCWDTVCVSVHVRRGVTRRKRENKQPVGAEQIQIEFFMFLIHLIHQNIFMHTHHYSHLQITQMIGQIISWSHSHQHSIRFAPIRCIFTATHLHSRSPCWPTDILNHK